LNQLSATFLSNPWYYLLLGLINPLAYYLILFKAYDLLPASQAQAINYSWAITLTLMAAVFLGQKIRGKDWIACGFSYLGVIVI
ncbi:DMT family transporter, partial [Escherichia coli]|nr:DMT family transporter [Escherichia coli]